MKVAVVMPLGPGRLENVAQALTSIKRQTRPADYVVVVEDGPALEGRGIDGLDAARSIVIQARKHEPGFEQPRNVGVRVATSIWPDITHAWFLDSDIVLEDDALEHLELALDRGPEDRILVAPYDWLAPGVRPQLTEPDPAGWAYEHWLERVRPINNDPRWQMFHASPPEKVYEADLSAGLACFSGNLLWPVAQFQRVGGFWSEIHHGRCEDGELGLRAVAMGVGISFESQARGYHLHHEVDTDLALERNQRDVPMLNERHPWVEGAQVFMVDRDGKAFDVRCSGCDTLIPTIQWWDHAVACGVTPELPVDFADLPA